jgi:putative heme-binding domain-containing protein
VRDLNKIFEQVVATSSPELIGQALRNYLLWTAVSKGVTQDHSAIYRSVEESLRDEKLPDQYRLSVMAYLNQLDPKRAKPFLHEYLKRPDLTPAGRASAYQEFLKTPPTEAEGRMVAEEFKTAPYTLALILAQGLAADASGTELLLQSIKKGEAPARLLQEPAILNLLKKHATPEIDQRIKSLTSGLASPDVRLAELIKKRVSAFPTASKDPIRGKEIFTKNCAVCHQLGGAGAKVGPQLDGIGIRGVERLMEDTLDPNRNVDEAFRATTFHMTDGRVLTGLLLRQDGQVQVLVDGTGKEHRIGAKDFEKQSTSRNSAMPSNLDTQISEADYFHLLAFLLQQKPK